MLDGLVGLLIALLILCLVVYVIFLIIDWLAPAPFNRIAKIIVAIIALIVILQRALPLLT